MKKLFLIASLLLSFNLHSQLIDTNPALNKFLMLLLENGILDERINSDREIARELCTTNGISARNLGPCNSISRAICRVNGISVMNLGPCNSISRAICRVNGISVMNLGRCNSISKALAMIPEDWDWDYFKANGQWRCRSIKTGRFAEDYNCRNDPKDDDRWPDK
jgi:hypothetical protein